MEEGKEKEKDTEEDKDTGEENTEEEKKKKEKKIQAGEENDGNKYMTNKLNKRILLFV